MAEILTTTDGGIARLNNTSSEIPSNSGFRSTSNLSLPTRQGNVDDVLASSITKSEAMANESAEHMPMATSAGISPQYTSDPFSLSQYKRSKIDKKSLRAEFPKAKPRQVKKFYTRQNELIEAYLGSAEEEAADDLDMLKNGPKIKFAQRGSFVVNVCLFIIQLYAAISTRSLSLFATAADAFMDVVSSTIMLITSRMAAKPKLDKYPVGRRRVEIIGIILFCAVMTLLAVELIIESARALAAGPSEGKDLEIVPLICVAVAIFSKGVMFIYCFALRRYPGVKIFMIDHRNDIVVNIFGLTMSIVGTHVVWWIDPAGAVAIATLILYSWVSTAFEYVPMLVGESAPTDFINKCVYLALTHDRRILKIDTVRAYHAGQDFNVEVDIIMDENTPLKISHDVSQVLQRKLEGLSEVERAFVHVDYEGNHSVIEEHKPPYDLQKIHEGETFVNRLKSNMFRLPWSQREGRSKDQAAGRVED